MTPRLHTKRGIVRLRNLCASDGEAKRMTSDNNHDKNRKKTHEIFLVTVSCHIYVYITILSFVRFLSFPLPLFPFSFPFLFPLLQLVSKRNVYQSTHILITAKQGVYLSPIQSKMNITWRNYPNIVSSRCRACWPASQFSQPSVDICTFPNAEVSPIGAVLGPAILCITGSTYML